MMACRLRAGAFTKLLATASLALVLLLLPRADSAGANPITGIASLEAGAGHVCAVTTAGGAKCWGLNIAGALGNGNTTTSLIPVDVVSLGSGVASVSAGNAHSCAVTTGGAAKCWGLNTNGQLGDGTSTNSSVPVNVVGLSIGVAAIAAGGFSTCALLTTGGVQCWGAVFGPTPISIGGVGGLGTSVAAISAGRLHYCALMMSSGVRCWGNNQFGQLGNGTFSTGFGAVQVTGLNSGVSQIETGYAHSCALTTSGVVKCWGWNFFNQLGDGIGTSSPVPINVPGFSGNATAVSAGGIISCAAITGGEVLCWGGQYGSPSVLPNITSAAQISVGLDFACAVLSSSDVKCWGNNVVGELGDGTTAPRLDPRVVVVADPKPTPTATPCPPAGCLVLPPCPAETCMGLGVLDANGNIKCHSELSTKCSVQRGEQFTLAIDAFKVPAAGYILAQASVSFDQSLVFKQRPVANDELVWPDSVVAIHDDFTPGLAFAGGFTALFPPFATSTFVGVIIEFDFTCPTSESTAAIDLLPNNHPVAGTSGALFTEAGTGRQITPHVSSFTITCTDVPPTATPLPPPGVGGVALDGELRTLPAAEPATTTGVGPTALWLAGTLLALLVLGGVAVRRQRG